MSGTKTCSKCATVKPQAEFNKRASAPDGRRPECRDCQRVARVVWVRENPEKVAEGKSRSSQWQKDNRERRLASAAKWREANPDYHRDYRAARPDIARASTRRYRARKAVSPCPSATHDEVAAMTDDFDNYACAVCFGPAEELDHIVPVSAPEGCDASHNLQWLCRACNRSKNARYMAEWLPQRLAHLERIKCALSATPSAASTAR